MDEDENRNNGIIAKRHEGTQVEWKITNFFSVVEDENIDIYISPEFRFGDLPFYFQLWKKGLNDPKYIELVLRTDEREKIAVEYNCGLEHVDGSIEKSIKGVLDVGNDEECSSACYFKLQEVQQRKSELAPSGVVTIVCSLKRVISFTQADESDEPKHKKLRKLDTLSENFKYLYENKDSCDTTLCVKNRVYKAHRAVLIARSSVFGAMFLHETSEKKTGIINITDCDPDSFEKFLKYLYCGTLEGLLSRSALHLYKTSDKYDVPELKTFCREFLIDNLTTENLCDVLILADKYNDDRLLNIAQQVFEENLYETFETSEWDSLVRNNYPLAKTLLKSMALQIKGKSKLSSQE